MILIDDPYYWRTGKRFFIFQYVYLYWRVCVWIRFVPCLNAYHRAQVWN